MNGSMTPGTTYTNAAPYAAPVHLQTIHRFQCLEISPHPLTGIPHAIGWAEIHPGVWKAGSVSAEDFVPHHWTEQQ